MATPATIVDGTTVFNAANANKFISSDGTAIQVKMWHARIRFDGVNTVVEPTFDSAGFTTAGLTFQSGPTEVDATLSGFTNPPIITVTPQGSTAYTVKLIAVTNVLATFGFFDINTGAKIATGTEDSNMDFHVQAIGF